MGAGVIKSNILGEGAGNHRRHSRGEVREENEQITGVVANMSTVEELGKKVWGFGRQWVAAEEVEILLKVGRLSCGLWCGNPAFQHVC